MRDRNLRDLQKRTLADLGETHQGVKETGTSVSIPMRRNQLGQVSSHTDVRCETELSDFQKRTLAEKMTSEGERDCGLGQHSSDKD